MKTTNATYLAGLLVAYNRGHIQSDEELEALRDGMLFMSDFNDVLRRSPETIYYRQIAEAIDRVLAARKS